MNYLAHLFLSCRDDQLLVGNYLGDWLSNRDLPHFPAGIQAGVRLHRQIDTFTDNHPLVLQGVRRLYPEHGKYGAVIIDVFYDYLLTRNWERYSEESFPVFRQRVYAVLEDARKYMPPKLANRVSAMTEADWLAGYATLEGTAHAISRIKPRASKPQLLDNSIPQLEGEYDLFNEEFNGFFPEVIEMVNAFCTAK